MTVCLHCGELASEGALFCAKCGYTLPQVDPSAKPVTPPSTAAVPPPGNPPPAGIPTPAPVMPIVAAPVAFGWNYTPAGYAVLAPPPIPGAVGPIPPPPAGKYCIRCRTLISRVAVYCPVCQQPQS